MVPDKNAFAQGSALNAASHTRLGKGRHGTLPPIASGASGVSPSTSVCASGSLLRTEDHLS